MKIKEKIKLAYEYFIGNYRYKIYHSKLSFLMRNHIKEQIDWRISVMNKECYTTGSCVICGCSTIALQMANKACPNPCYPKMMNKSDWKLYVKNVIN